jgi:hypothetical protein
MSVREFNVRLPGSSGLVTFFSQEQLTARQLIYKIAEQFQLQDPEQRILVSAPTLRSPGNVIEDDELIPATGDPDEVHPLLSTRTSLLSSFSRNFPFSFSPSIFSSHSNFGWNLILFVCRTPQQAKRYLIFTFLFLLLFDDSNAFETKRKKKDYDRKRDGSRFRLPLVAPHPSHSKSVSPPSSRGICVQVCATSQRKPSSSLQ